MKEAIVKEYRKEVKKFIDKANDKTILMVHALLKVENEVEKAYEQEIEQRFSDFENGMAKTITLSELELGARKALKVRRANL